MTILKLAIDASAAKQGAREVEQAVDQVGRSAERAGKAVDTAAKEVGRSLDAQADKAKNFSKTVEAVGEVTQISQRVRLLGEEVRNLGSGMSSAASIGQTLSGALVDIAQISGKVEGGFGGFVTLLRANPLLVAATVIGGIATAMSLFSGETKDANEELKQQIQLQEELRKTSVDLALQLQRNIDLGAVGFPVDLREQELLKARRLAETASGLAGQGGFQTFADLQSLTGLSEQELRNRAGRGGIAGAYLPGQTISVPGTGVGTTTAGRFVEQGITNEAARAIILEVAALIRRNAPEAQAVASEARSQAAREQASGFTSILNYRQIAELQRRGIDQGPGFEGIFNARQIRTLSQQQAAFRDQGPGFEGILDARQIATLKARYEAPEREAKIAEEQQRARLLAEELDRLNERLQQLKSLGQDVGAAIGGAFFSIVNGAANARQALAALLQQFVAIAQQRAIQGIANSIGNAFGSTVQQTNSNTSTNVRVPPTTGGGTSGGGLA